MLPTLAPPPRPVPLSLRVLNIFNAGAVFGWLFFAFGMIFVWAFGANADFSFLTFAGQHPRVQGRVTQVENTNASENKQRITANHYQFSVAGKSFTGKSYSTGGQLEQDDDVTIEYDENNPARSRIAGMRRAMFGPWVSFVILFPLVGAVIAFFSMRGGPRRNRLLREGLLTTGKLVSKTATNMTVNNRRVYELTFEFVARDGRRGQASARTSLVERLQDEATEPLLYDPADPNRAFMLDEVPTRPQIVNGELQGRPVAAFFAALLPVGALIVHGFVLWMYLR
ncbi:MAG TPA: DUF3592 domain-containing protein [Thermoanaerobaculia bacterium]|nr:DUF3592 domain-containing protein [Thermoanaerobaculia bacterium]